MRIIGRAAILIERASALKLMTALIMISIMKNGIWFIPNNALSARLASDPFRNPFVGEEQYLFDNWLGPFLAWLSHMNSPHLLVGMNFVFSAIFIATTYLSLRARLSIASSKKALCLFASLPVFWTHLYWIGYDSVTLACMACALAFLSNPWLSFSFAVGVGLQHAQQGVVGFGLLSALIYLQPRDEGSRFHGLRGAVAALGGVIAGRGILSCIVLYFGINLDGGHSSYFLEHASTIMSDNAYSLEAFVFGTLGLGWLPILYYGQNGACRATLFASLAVCSAVAFLTIDVTRVFAIITYPVIYHCLLTDETWLRSATYRNVAAIMVIWLVVPWLFDWQGRFRATVFPYDVALVSHAIIGRPSIPENTAAWPFLPLNP